MQHRLSGYIWIGIMPFVFLSSFFIYELRLWGLSSPIHLLSQTPIDFVYKTKTSDYRTTVPLFHLGWIGQLDEVRWTSWLRAPTLGCFDEINRIHRAKNLSAGKFSSVQSLFQAPGGDIMCFDNRRVLYGHTSFEPARGGRSLRGC